MNPFALFSWLRWRRRNIVGDLHEMDPIERFKVSLAEAERRKVPLANAMSLATVRSDARPAVRMVLLKGVSDKGFVFYTNLRSRKGPELEANPYASLCFWWPALQEQVRVDGVVEPVEDAEADAYFASRPRGSQIGAWASKQSEVLPSREVLMQEVDVFKERFLGTEVLRPPFWSGFALVPERIEFWLGKPDRLHDRFIYTKEGTAWVRGQLYP